MKKLKCTFNGNDKKKKTLIITNVNIASLADPINYTESDEHFDNEETRYTKKRSEVVDKDDEMEYKKLELKDGDNKTFSCKRTDTSNHFAFINMGSYIKIVPITSWIRATLQAGNRVGENADINLEVKEEKEAEEEAEEIDFEDRFDDDNSEDEIVVRHEKKLSKAGRKMKKLVKAYEDEEFDLKRIIGRGKITTKELINLVKDKAKMDDKMKETIRLFIKDECIVENGPDGKLISLKKP